MDNFACNGSHNKSCEEFDKFSESQRASFDQSLVIMLIIFAHVPFA